MRNRFLVCCLSFLAGCEFQPVYGQVAQLGWDVQQDRPVPHEVLVWQGETVDLLPRLVQGIRPVAITNAPVEFRYREASLPTNTYRYVAASANTNNGVIAVHWIPDYDAGAPWYDYQVIVGSNAANPRCFGRIVMRPTIGWHASTNAPTPITLYPTRAEFQAVSNAFAIVLQTVITNETDAAAKALLATHTNRTDNPHRVTAVQIGALTNETDAAAKALLATHTNRTDNPHRVTAVQIGALTNETDAAAKALLATHTNRTDNPHRVTASQIGALTSETDAKALAALATNRVTRVYSPDASQWIDGTGGVWRVSQSTELAYRITDGYDMGPYEVGNEFYFVSDVTVTNSPYVTRTISYGNLKHYRHGYINNTWDGDGGWGLYIDGGLNDFFGDFAYPLIGTLYPGNVDPYVTLQSFQRTVTVTNHADTVQFTSQKELHADSFTNLIWRTVWSNGWCWAIAYTNTP